jgi:hypothetical protein
MSIRSLPTPPDGPHRTADTYSTSGTWTGQPGRVKAPPSCLPSAQSTKWNNRRQWDYLGYVRVRKIAKPAWRRDASWFHRVLTLERSQRQGQARDLIDAAIEATSKYRSLRQQTAETDDDFDARRGRDWDEILGPLDEFLELRQRDHLRAVREAAASGPQVPSSDAP